MKRLNRVKFSRTVDSLAAVVLLVALVSLVFEIDWLDNTIGGLELFWRSLAIGSVAGLMCALPIGYFNNDLLGGLVSPAVRVMRFSLGAALLFRMLSVAGASYANRIFGEEAEYKLAVLLTDKGTRHSNGRVQSAVIGQKPTIG